MTTCFLFAEQLDENACLSLNLDPSGQVAAPLQMRSFTEIKELQKDAHTIVVVPTEKASVQEVELPWLGERKGRAALPYALEEQLAQPVPSLHFAFDKAHYQNQRYLVVVMDKQYLFNLLKTLTEAGLLFDAVTIDWFAVMPGQAVFGPKNLLVNESNFKGALDGELTAIYLKTHALNNEIHLFTDSNSSYASLETAKRHDSAASVFIAQQLMKNAFINLLQGEFYRDATKDNAKFWYKLSGAVLILWLLSVITMNIFQLLSLNKKIAAVDAQIAVIYKEFFPDAQHVISPKFRITQLLKSSTNIQGSIWVLLDKLAPALRAYQLTVQQFRFQNHTLSITLNAKDFDILENLQSRLKQDGVKVVQTQASSQDDQVLATLELTL